jgi:hypothetical protein
VVHRALPARLRCNSGELAAGLGGEGLGEVLRATWVRFGVLDRGGMAPASGSPAAREGRPRRWLFRRGCGQCAVTGGGGGSRGC